MVILLIAMVAFFFALQIFELRTRIAEKSVQMQVQEVEHIRILTSISQCNTTVKDLTQDISHLEQIVAKEDSITSSSSLDQVDDGINLQLKTCLMETETMKGIY